MGEHALKNLIHAMKFKNDACDKEHNDSYLVKHTFNYYVSIIINIFLFYLSVIISVMTFEGTDCCLVDIGRLADSTGGRVRVKQSLFTGDDAATRGHHPATILTIAALVRLR